MNSVIVQLASVDVDEFDEALRRVFSQVGAVLDVVAIGESTIADNGVGWRDPARITEEELRAVADQLRRAPDADGPFSMPAPDGRVVVGAPASSDGFSRFTAVIVDKDVEARPDGVLALELLSSVVGAARRRVVAERELRASVDRQLFLSDLSNRAATEPATDATLQAILDEVRDYLGITAASTLVREGDQLELVATTDYLGTHPLVPGHRSDATIAHLLELTRSGHLVRDLDSLVRQGDRPVSNVGEVLCVPRFGPDGVSGVVVFTDAAGREWTPGEIEAAKSIARSVEKLTIRAETDRSQSYRRGLDRLLSEIAATAATATLDNLVEVVGETLHMAIDCFGIAGASVWVAGRDEDLRIVAGWSGGETSAQPVVASMPAAERAAILVRGHGFVEVTDEMHPEPTRALVLPIGTDPAGFIVFVDADRWWSGDDIAAGRTLANLADQTRARLHADLLIRNRLRDEEYIATVAALSVDVDVDNIDERLDDLLRLALEHHGVGEASIWRREGATVRCRAAVRRDGRIPSIDLVLSVPDFGPLTSRGWAVIRLGDLDFGGRPQFDSFESRLLITSFGGTDGVGGLVVLTDSPTRIWTDNDISSAQVFADTVGHLRMRMRVARRLARQQEVDEILAVASRDFVDTTLDDAREVVDGALERIRDRFGLAGLTLLELDHATTTLECTAEVTDDGLRLLGDVFPVSRDHPAVARILDPGGPDLWRLGDLFEVGTAADHTATIIPAIRGRDILVLVAAHRSAESFDGDQIAALDSLTTLLAQLRRRLLLERHSRRRAEADQLVAEIARTFVEQPPHDHDDAVVVALARIGEFFGLRSIARWRIRPDHDPVRELRWADPDLGTEGIDTSGTIDLHHPLSVHLQSLGEAGSIELGALATSAPLTSDTLSMQRVSRDGPSAGLLVAMVPAPPHLVTDLDILEDVLARVARLMEQLWRRADADLAVARQLRHEDLLRRFATSLVTAEPDAVDTLEVAFRELMSAVGVDQATIFHFQPHDDGFDVDAVLHVADGEVGPLPEPFLAFRLPPGFTDADRAPHFSAMATTWSRDDAPEGIRQLIRTALPDGPRQVAHLPAPGSEPQGEGSYLMLSRPGDEAFRPDELEFFRSAHSILIQHEARVAAERWFGAAFNSAPIGISLREADLRLIHCNAAYSEFVGRPVAELVGTTLDDVMPPEMAEARSVLFEQDGPVDHHTESSYRRPDGTIRWASVRSTPVELPGRRGRLLLTYVEDITERRRSREMLEYQATHDELTGLPNRRALVAEVTAELAQPGDCAVLVLDLDRFKVVNDSLGHSVGDQLLVTCADRIRLSLRPGDSVCRLGGDEFAVLLRAPADTHAAGVVADRLLTLLREPVVIGADEVYPSASIGIAIPDAGDTVEDLLRHADAAMYQAKGQGRDRWEAFDGSMRQAVVDRIRTESDLRRAIDNGQLEVHYQPEVLLESGEIVGNEALVRWRHPERGLLPAGAFIGLAEETGLVVDIGRWVLSVATAQAARWVAEGHDVITRVNLSARQLRGAVVAEVEAALGRAALAPDRLCLELTETAIMDDVQESARILARFRDLGVQVAIDDFGTGFSSLAYLKRLPVDILKIDRTFVDGVGVDPDDTAIVRSVIGLARTLRLEVVAEGIEDETQAAELVRLGCGRGQGFHLARPGSAADISALLARGRTVRGDAAGE